MNVEETKVKITINYNNNQWAWWAIFYLLSNRNFVIIEMNGHFFSWITGKEFVRDTLKVLEIVQETYKCISPFFTDDNLITTLCSFHIQPHQLIASLLNDLILNLKSYLMIIYWTHIDQLSFISNLNKIFSICNLLVHTEEDLGPLQHLRWRIFWQ